MTLAGRSSQQRNSSSQVITDTPSLTTSSRNGGSRPRTIQTSIAPVIISSTQSTNNTINVGNALVSGYGAGGFGGARGPSDGYPGGYNDGGNGTGGFVRIFWHNH